MEKNKKIKISLTTAIIIGIIIIILISIIGIGIYRYITKNNSNIEKTPQQNIENNITENDIIESDIKDNNINGYCRIKEKNQIYYIKMNMNQTHHIQKKLFT